MEIVEGSSSLRSELRTPIVTIGNFDGVHVGHQKIFQTVTRRAREMGGQSVCYTFDPHPQRIIAPDYCPPLLITRRKKIALIARQGIDVLIIEPFTHAFSQQSAEDFLTKVLHAQLAPKEVYVGHDFHFGKGRAASFASLQSMGEKLGFGVHVIEEVLSEDEEVSSSRIRRLVAEGKVEEAARLLGRAFTVEGTVIPGAARGHTLGFATANVEVENELLPADGVYAVFGRLGGPPEQDPREVAGAAMADPLAGKRLLAGVANIGFAPTFGARRRALEVHFLDVEGNLYGSHVEVLFLGRLREERKFSDAGALMDQIGRDVEAARRIHAENEWRAREE